MKNKQTKNKDNSKITKQAKLNNENKNIKTNETTNNTNNDITNKKHNMQTRVKKQQHQNKQRQ